MKKNNLSFYKLGITFLLFILSNVSPAFSEALDSSYIFGILMGYIIPAMLVIYSGFLAKDIFRTKRSSFIMGATFSIVGSSCVGIIFSQFYPSMVSAQINWKDPAFYIAGLIMLFIGGVLGLVGSYINGNLHKEAI